MTCMNEEEYLPLSGIQHFRFCRRQWALIHMEQWEQNLHTVEGALLHQTSSRRIFVYRPEQAPPIHPVNAMLSFVYTLLAHDCASALEAVGLDAYVGFLHRDRPGRMSLALDIMEELR